jgi:hypothetical protein
MTSSFYRLVWLLPVAFILHVGEEFFTGYPAYAGEVTGHPMPLAVFLGSNILFIVFMALLSRWTVASHRPAAIFWTLVWAAGNEFWNFVYHLISVVAYDRHSPGLVTGSLIYVPLSVLLWQAAIAEKQIRRTSLAAAIGLGAVLMAVVAAVGIYHVGGV